MKNAKIREQMGYLTRVREDLRRQNRLGTREWCDK